MFAPGFLGVWGTWRGTSPVPDRVWEPATADDVVAAAVRARQAHVAWASWPVVQRRRWRNQVLRLVWQHRTRLASLAQQDCGLSPLEAVEDQRAALRSGRSVPVAIAPAGQAQPVEAELACGLTDQAAPLSSLVGGVLPPLLAGRCVITATDQATTVLAGQLHSLARSAGLPDDVWTLVSGQQLYTKGVLAEHTDICRPACCPPRTAPGSRTRPALLVVRHDARVRRAVNTALRSCFAGAGRRCTSTPLIAVHESRYEAFLTLFTAAARRLAVHCPAAPEAHLGTLVGDDQVRDVRAFLRGCGDFGGRVLHDGGHQPQLGPLVHGPAVVRCPGLDRIPPGRIPPGPVAIVASYQAWSEVLHYAQRCGRHVSVHTATPMSQLAPQFAAQPGTDLRLVMHPRIGLRERLGPPQDGKRRTVC